MAKSRVGALGPKAPETQLTVYKTAPEGNRHETHGSPFSGRRTGPLRRRDHSDCTLVVDHRRRLDSGLVRAGSAVLLTFFGDCLRKIPARSRGKAGGAWKRHAEKPEGNASRRLPASKFTGHGLALGAVRCGRSVSGLFGIRIDPSPDAGRHRLAGIHRINGIKRTEQEKP